MDMNDAIIYACILNITHWLFQLVAIVHRLCEHITLDPMMKRRVSFGINLREMMHT